MDVNRPIKIVMGEMAVLASIRVNFDGGKGGVWERIDVGPGPFGGIDRLNHAEAEQNKKQVAMPTRFCPVPKHSHVLKILSIVALNWQVR